MNLKLPTRKTRLTNDFSPFPAWKNHPPRVTESPVWTFPPQEPPMAEVYGGYDIIVLVTNHGLSVNTSMEDYDRRQILSGSEPYNLDIIESASCGVHNFTYARGALTFIEAVLDEYEKSPDFLDKLQYELRDFQKGTIDRLMTDKNYLRFKETDGFNLVSNQNGYVERLYLIEPRKDDYEDEIIVIQVLRVTNGPFEQNQPLLDLLQKYKTHRLIGNTKEYTTRSDLFKLLMDSGYKHPLIIDLSCGTFVSEQNGMTEEQSRLLTQKARDSKHAGSLKKHRRKSKKIRKRLKTN